MATAVTAGGIGVALGSSLRFQMLSVGQTQIFKPQQDFPALAEWPPQIPTSRDENDWDTEAPQPQLVYSDRVSGDTEADVYGETYEENLYREEESNSAPPVLTEQSSYPTVGGLHGDTEAPIGEGNYEAASPPAIDPIDVEPDDNVADTPSVENSAADSITESYPWFDKRPLSEAQFVDGPAIITPEDLTPSSEALLD
ncbi:MAG: hypothetical protein ACFB2W_19530 [Leptolyngbyaceae cyanobacterium]